MRIAETVSLVFGRGTYPDLAGGVLEDTQKPEALPTKGGAPETYDNIAVCVELEEFFDSIDWVILMQSY